MTQKVSIIVPVYNDDLHLDRCLNSILNQTYENIELVIVDDGSTDFTGSIIKKFSEKDSRIKYYYQANSGPSEARNNGINNSSGDYILFIDSDDTIEQDYVCDLVTEMINTGSDLVCCGYNDISNYGEVKRTDFNFDGVISYILLWIQCVRGLEGYCGVRFSKEKLL